MLDFTVIRTRISLNKTGENKNLHLIKEGPVRSLGRYAHANLNIWSCTWVLWKHINYKGWLGSSVAAPHSFWAGKFSAGVWQVPGAGEAHRAGVVGALIPLPTAGTPPCPEGTRVPILRGRAGPELVPPCSGPAPAVLLSRCLSNGCQSIALRRQGL